MDLHFNISLAEPYVSNSQIARVLTEAWVKQNIYCPSCGEPKIYEYENNKPVADFYCGKCCEDFELKSKSGSFASKIVDGAYSTMVERVTSSNNPNFFFLTYNRKNWTVNNFAIIPKHFFTLEIIEKRKPLGVSARRAGWTGCNIDISRVPESGKIFFIKSSVVQQKQVVLTNWEKTLFLKDSTLASRGWTIDVLNCLDKLNNEYFRLTDVYAFEAELKARHPQNNHIKEKIRQQLQVLRDKGFLEFVSSGVYRKVRHE